MGVPQPVIRPMTCPLIRTSCTGSGMVSLTLSVRRGSISFAVSRDIPTSVVRDRPVKPGEALRSGMLRGNFVSGGWSPVEVSGDG